VFAVFLLLFWAVDRLGRSQGPQGSHGGAAAPATGGTAAATTAAPSGAVPASTAPPGTHAASTVPPSSSPAGAGVPTTVPTTLPSPRGVTVQVLQTAVVTNLGRRAAARIRQAGYTVVAVSPALGDYPVSRVYYTGGHLADAEAFRARFPVFAVVAPAPPRLSRRVALHVLLGRNYRGG
jgi:hypothetical protein